MTLIVCVDDNMGLVFNKRRQSKDRVLTKHILDRVAERPAWTTAYTAKMLFLDDSKRPINWKISDVLFGLAKPGEICFAEDISGEELARQRVAGCIEAVWLYHWNRLYPADTFFPLDMTAPCWVKTEQTEIRGYTHNTILEEIYEKI